MSILEKFSLKGQRALVTGASQGIGRACAQALAEAGAHVILTARDAGALAQVAGDLKAAGHSAEWYVLDVTDHKPVEKTEDGSSADDEFEALLQ